MRWNQTTAVTYDTVLPNRIHRCRFVLPEKAEPL